MTGWEDVIAFIGGSTVLLGFAAWLAKSIVTHQLTKDAKTFETNLNAEHTQALELLKSDLQLEVSRREWAFKKLHDERAKIIGQVYSRLVKAINGVEHFLSPALVKGGPGRDSLFEEAINRLYDLQEYYDQHLIWLPPEVGELLDQFVSRLRVSAVQFHPVANISPVDPETRKAVNELWRESREESQNVGTTLRRCLEEKFRELIDEPA